MGPLSRWAVNKPKSAIAAWLVMAIVTIVLAAGFGGTYNNSFALPDTESTRAQALLSEIPGAGASLDAVTSKVVWRSASGAANDPSVSAPITAMLTDIAAVPAVDCVITPYGAPLGTGCPQPATGGPASGASPGAAGAVEGAAKPTTPQVPAETAKVLAGLSQAGFSVDGTIGYATVLFHGVLDDLDPADALAVLNTVTAANTDALTVGANGSALEYAGMEPPSSEGIGITVALVILLFTFGSIVGAFLPVLSAVISLGVGQALVLITANFLDVATFAPTLAAMIGLGVGIDYSLFVINRYKQALDVGREPRAAALESVATSGRAVVFAAATVIIALLGLFVLRINFFNGLAVAAAATVVVMMIGATILLPAVLSLLGTRAFAWKLPWARKPRAHHERGGAFARYGNWLQHNFRWVGALALLVLLVVAIPVGSLRLGFTDDSGKPEGSSARIAYDLVSEGFGPGINGPFVIAIQTQTPGDNEAVTALTTAVSSTPGVAAAIGAPMADAATVTALQVIPTTGPQDEATTELLNTLRDEVIPQVQASQPLAAYVGGMQAITADFTSVLTDALPVFLAVVIGLGFLALLILFRSVLVPLTGAVTSLLSLGAAMGVTVAVFQWGWAANLVGLSGTGPIMPFLPIMVFAILFGLSMDYQVFLVSRMQEEWLITKDNTKAVRRGLAASGRVVAIAAAIMFSVFFAFVLGNDSMIKLFGLALSTAVLFDAFIVRLIIVPSVMHQLGAANWWLPKWLDRILPNVTVEHDVDPDFEAEIDDIPDQAVATKG